MSTPAGWYPNGDQWETYWDGNAWTDQHRPRQQTPPPPAAEPEQDDVAVVPTDGSLLRFTSHITGKNAIVTIWPDRVEWIRPRGISGGKVTAAMLTLGTSALMTGFRDGKTGTEMIPVRSISSVTTRRDGFRNTIVSVIASGNTVDFRIGHKEAEQVKSTLTQLIAGSHPSQQSTPTPTVQATPGPATADIGAQLQQLASLRDAGVLTEAEFTAKKTEILARM